jgi:D-serine deaminase-like pyridoxal phosphate-dependent protein
LRSNFSTTIQGLFLPARVRRFPLSTTTDPEPRTLADLETPCALVDLDRLAANLDRMASYTVLHGLALRPHVKTHKSPRIAAQQMGLGAVGLSCATPRELEVMSEVSRIFSWRTPSLVRRACRVCCRCLTRYN